MLSDKNELIQHLKMNFNLKIRKIKYKSNKSMPYITIQSISI